MKDKNSEFSKILVCIDGSKYSKLALLKAISLAEKYQSKLYLLMVIEESIIDFWNETEFAVGFKRPQVHPKKDSKTWKSSQKILKNMSKTIPSKIEFSEKIIVGDVVNEIIDFAKTKKVDLIILGAKGKGTFTKLLLGSVSSKVSNHSKSSVLIVR